jgi:transposase
MDEAAITGIDLAKRVFQLHAAGDDGRVLYRETLSRSQMLRFLARQPRCVVAMEACATAHSRGRIIAELGYEVRLVPPDLHKAVREAPEE